MVESTRWLVSLKQNPHAKLHLICFPYAGGGVPVFRNWVEELPAEVGVRAVLLPGRGSRFNEEPFKRLAQVVSPLAQEIQRAAPLPFAFYGHSLGALIGFELARELRRQSAPMPVCLFLSGREAPHWIESRPAIHDLPDTAFVQELMDFNGTPAEVVENAELMQLLLPVVRADFEIAEKYRYYDESPLECSIRVFGGLGDEQVTIEGLEAWREHTCAEFSMRMQPGDHFFIHNQRELFLRALAEDLRKVMDLL